MLLSSTPTVAGAADDGGVEDYPALVDDPPTADIGGPYFGTEGEYVALDASASSDPGDMSLSYTWDLDDDGVFDDASGAYVYRIVAFEDGVYPISLRVENDDGHFDIAHTTVTLENRPPILSVSGDRFVVAGELYTLPWRQVGVY